LRRHFLGGPNALWPTQRNFWVGHGPPKIPCGAPHVVARLIAHLDDRNINWLGIRDNPILQLGHLNEVRRNNATGRLKLRSVEKCAAPELLQILRSLASCSSRVARARL
jgi:hypothetical protein